MDRLKELLEKGYFPIQLPPGFSSTGYANNYKKFEMVWEEKKAPSTRVEKFSVARSSYYRRITSIVNPISYFLLAKAIDKYWPKIEEHYKKSEISLSIPSISPEIRAIKIKKFSDLYEAKIIKSTGYRFVLITDISSFFPNIYTHTIPWALHSKADAKKNKTKKNDTFFGNLLDSRSMGIQDWQTIGLPIGPDTSHIIAEIIGVAIDVQVKDTLKDWPNGFRYVDDFYFFFDTREDAEKTLAVLIKAIGNFELQINASKTRIIEVKELVEESWKYSLKKLIFSSERKKQRDDIHNYFELLFSLEKKFLDESLIKYGLKQISSYIIKKDNWDIFEAYLLKCGYSFPNTLQLITNILSTYHHYNYELNIKAITRFCNNLLKVHAISDHHGEVSWLLWLCKELSLKVKKDTLLEIERMNNSVCTLISLDLFYSGILKNNFNKEYLHQFVNKESLYTSDWLLSYEAGRRGWLGNSNFDYIKNDEFYSKLFEEKIGFYDDTMRCNPIFNFKDSELNIFNLFNSDDRIERYFDFDEVDEEYFDALENNEFFEDIDF